MYRGLISGRTGSYIGFGLAPDTGVKINGFRVRFNHSSSADIRNQFIQFFKETIKFHEKKAKTRTDQERGGIYVILNMEEFLWCFMIMTRAGNFCVTYTHTHSGHLIWGSNLFISVILPWLKFPSTPRYDYLAGYWIKIKLAKDWD